VTRLRLHRSGAWYAATVLCPNPSRSSLRLVDRPGLADASFQGTVEPWIRGGRDLSDTKPTKIGGSLTLLDPAKRPLWSVGAEQWNPLRLMADGLFARDPSALPPIVSAQCLNSCRGTVSRGTL
jgi:hypothetical protein